MYKRILLFLITVVFIFGISKLSLAMTCDDHAQLQVAQIKDSGNKSESVNVGNKICPVSGEKVGEGMEPATYEYQGKIYNFCCSACIPEFKKDPEKYIKKVNEEPAQVPKVSAQ
ncbi:MAG: YHS domain-containing protein [Candidatus Omnitrophota bacterium]|nr:YHS domain-containing protein [Candidatus Omnitrophota bacterium]